MDYAAAAARAFELSPDKVEHAVLMSLCQSVTYTRVDKYSTVRRTDPRLGGFIHQHHRQSCFRVVYVDRSQFPNDRQTDGRNMLEILSNGTANYCVKECAYLLVVFFVPCRRIRKGWIMKRHLMKRDLMATKGSIKVVKEMRRW